MHVEPHLLRTLRGEAAHAALAVQKDDPLPELQRGDELKDDKWACGVVGHVSGGMQTRIRWPGIGALMRAHVKAPPRSGIARSGAMRRCPGACRLS